MLERILNPLPAVRCDEPTIPPDAVPRDVSPRQIILNDEFLYRDSLGEPQTDPVIRLLVAPAEKAEPPSSSVSRTNPEGGAQRLEEALHI